MPKIDRKGVTYNGAREYRQRRRRDRPL